MHKALADHKIGALVFGTVLLGLALWPRLAASSATKG
jgi:hypothetical protein